MRILQLILTTSLIFVLVFPITLSLSNNIGWTYNGYDLDIFEQGEVSFARGDSSEINLIICQEVCRNFGGRLVPLIFCYL